jgi:hypothetical protein
MPLSDNIKPDPSRSSDFLLKPPHCMLIACPSPTLRTDHRSLLPIPKVPWLLLRPKRALLVIFWLFGSQTGPHDGLKRYSNRSPCQLNYISVNLTIALDRQHFSSSSILKLPVSHDPSIAVFKFRDHGKPQQRQAFTSASDDIDP